MEKAIGTRGQAAGSIDGSGGIIMEPPEDDAPTLSDLGISKSQSSRWQLQESVSPEKFEEWLNKIRVAVIELTRVGEAPTRPWDVLATVSSRAASTSLPPPARGMY